MELLRDFLGSLRIALKCLAQKNLQRVGCTRKHL